MILEQLKEKRVDAGISQEKMAEELHISRDTYLRYENGSAPMPSDILLKLADKFKVSTDYILGLSDCTSVDNDYINKHLGISDDAINGLREVQKRYADQLAEIDVASSYGLDMQPYHTIDILNFILSNPQLVYLLTLFEDYITPEYRIPMCYMSASESPTGKARYHIPHNAIHEIGGQTYLPLVRDESQPTDFRLMPIDESFMENKALLDMQKTLNALKTDYLQAQADASTPPAKKPRKRKKPNESPEKTHEKPTLN
jgi:transcriptional regulator with XRE-family HTH domain